MMIAGYNLPLPDAAVQDGHLLGWASSGIESAMALGLRSDEYLSQQLKLAVLVRYGLLEQEMRDPDLRIWVLQVIARLKSIYADSFPATANKNPHQFDGQSLSAEDDSFFGNLDAGFAEAGRRLDAMVSPNLKAFSWFAENAWWLVPVGVGVYVAGPALLKSSIKAVK